MVSMSPSRDSMSWFADTVRLTSGELRALPGV